MLAVARTTRLTRVFRGLTQVAYDPSFQSHGRPLAEPPVTGPARVIVAPSASELDHNRLLKCTLTKREFIPPAPAAVAATAGTTFQPSAGGRLCQGWAFGYSLFYKDRYLRPDLLAKAAAALATELPALAGRVRPPSSPPGLRRLGDLLIDVNGAGIELALAETKAHRLEDLGPHTWVSGAAGRPLSGFGVPFYTEPFSVESMHKGEEALFKIKLTRCVDGTILSVVASHLLADAGRAVRLVERLGALYRAAATGADPGPPLAFNPGMETAEGLAAEMVAAPTRWDPSEKDHRLTLRQWLAAPGRLRRHVTSKYDLHMVYLPKSAVKRLKAVAVAHAGRVGGGRPVSTNDALQAFIATIVADLRRRPLVPTFPEEMTVNVDFLHRDVGFRDPGALARHVGSIAHILHVPGVSPGTKVPAAIEPTDSDAAAEAKLAAAVGINAAIIRRSVAEFRADPRLTLQALQRQARQAALPELQLGAAFVVKGADMKVASTTAVNAFSFDQIDFGCGAPLYAQINYQPRFDWWTIIQGAEGYGDGVLCTMTLAAGLGRALATHPAWRVLAPEAHIFLANEEGKASDSEEKAGQAGPTPEQWRAPGHA